MDDRSLTQVLSDQCNVISRAQALRYMSKSKVTRRIASDGPWQIILPTVYGAFTGAPTPQQLRIAAMLYAGPGAFITGFDGCRRYGLTKVPSTRCIQVATSRDVASTSFVQVDRTRRKTWTETVAGVTYALMPRCVTDAALRMPRLDDVRALIAEAMRRRMRLDLLQRELAVAPRQGSANLRRAVADIVRGARSAPECKHIAVLSASKFLPALHFNCSLMGPEGWIADPDAYCEQSGVAQEIDSVEWHIDAAAWRATMERASRMVSYGIRVLQAAPSRLNTDPTGIRQEFERAHKIGNAAGPPAGIWVKCRPGCLAGAMDAAPGPV
jgi:hypothetical protein